MVALAPPSVWLPSTPGYAPPNLTSSWRPPADGQPLLTQGFHVIRWMEACLVHTEGEWLGKPFRLMPWQKRLLLELFTLEEDPEWVAPAGWDGVRRFRAGLRRRYREAFISVPKKNGKTELAAAIALYLLIGDEESSPKGVFAAGALHQAGLSFRAATTMLRHSPVLRMLAPEREVGDLVVEIPSIPGSRLERVAAAEGTNDGPSLHFGVLDEVHEWQGERGHNVHGIITNAGAARRNSLFVSISTVGLDEEDDEQVWVTLWQRGWAAVEHPEADPRFYFLAARAPEGSHWQDERTWQAANPSAGVTVTYGFYQQQWAKGEGWCQRYYLNIPPGVVEDPWMDPELWASCAGDVVLSKAQPVHANVRMAHDHRVAAVALAQRQGERVGVRVRLFEAQRSEYVDLAALEAYLLSLRARYSAKVAAAPPPVAGRPPSNRVRLRPGPEVTYHGTFFEGSAQRLRAAGMVVLDVPDSQERRAPAAEALLQLATAGSVVHDGDHVLAAHVAAVVAKQADKGWHITAPSGRRRIEEALAAMFAVHRALTAPPMPNRTLRPPRVGR